ncbi:MAG: hypothetical protein IKK42_02950 [Oscillospiraceae bacterium]|nr:hypothetical protein [Oscillospiraceae bacterium]
MKNFGRILKCTAAAAVCMLAFSGCNKYDKMMDETPMEYVNLAAENTTSAMVKSAFAEEGAIIEKAMKDGTMGFSFNYDDIKMSSDNYVNEAGKKASGTYTIDIAGEKVELYYAVDNDTVKIGESGKTAGETVVEFNAKTLVDDLAGSIFAPGSGSAMELSQEDYDMIVEALGEVVAAVNGETEETPEEYAEIEAIVDEMMKEATVEKKVDITVDETEVKANIITINFDKADIEKLADAYVDVTVKEMAEQGEEVSKEEVKAELDEAMKSIGKMDINLVYYVNSKTHCLMQADCTVDMSVTADGETQDVKVNSITNYGVDPAASNTVKIDMTVEAGGEKLELDVVSERKDENETDVKIDMSMQGVSMQLVALNFKKDGENYTITANIPVVEATATIGGTLKTTSDSVEATVDTVSYAMTSEGIDGNLESFNIKGYIKQGGTFDNRDAKNFFKLTEEELMTMVEAIGTDFGALAGETEVGGAMVDYVDASQSAAANANAKTVYVAFASALTEMAVAGEEFEDFEFNNTSVTSTGYDLNIAEYLGNDFTGYYYAYVNPFDYMVEYAIWSDSPIEYPWQYSESDLEWLSEDGVQIGCYPLADY